MYSLLLCLSLAIYQSYISLVVVLSICYLIIQLLENKMTVRGAWKWIGRQAVIYVLALVSYYVIWKGILLLTDRVATDYQGISSVGQITLSTILNACVKSVKNLVLYLVEWNYFNNPITAYAFLNTLFIVCFAIVFVVAVIKGKVYKNMAQLLMIILCMIAGVPIISIWCFTSDTVAYRPMMMHSVCALYILGLLLFDRWLHPKVSTLIGIGTAAMVFNFALMANISYFYLEKCYEKSYYTGSQIMERIELVQTEHDEITQIAFIGNRRDEVDVIESFPGDRIHILAGLLEQDLLFDSVHTYYYLQNVFDLDLSRVSAEEIAVLQEREDVKDMPEWPAVDSVQVIDGILVIKLDEDIIP